MLEKLAFVLQPGIEILQSRMDLFDLLDISTIALIMEPFEHEPQILGHHHNKVGHKAERSGHTMPRLGLKFLCHLLEGKLIACQRETLVLESVVLQEDLGRNDADVASRDALERLSLYICVPGREGNFADKVWCKVVEKEHRSQNGPIHRPVFGFLE